MDAVQCATGQEHDRFASDAKLDGPSVVLGYLRIIDNDAEFEHALYHASDREPAIERLKGNYVYCELKYSPNDGNGRFSHYSIERPSGELIDPTFDREGTKANLLNSNLMSDWLRYPFQKLKDIRTHRLMADRNVRPEKEDSSISIKSDGAGVTNVIRACLRDAGRSGLIEKELLAAINQVFEPERSFKKIDVKDAADGSGLQEVCFEDGNNWVHLSNMGSGMKTVLCVLALLQLAGDVSSPRVLIFEEPERGLHPSMQRTLFKAVRDHVTNSSDTVFITTHSNVAIDFFASDHLSQLVHVRHDGQNSVAERFDSTLATKEVLDDLGVRASDLLQTNIVIWVEGPSDRIYLNHWIELLAEGEVTDGQHYSVLLLGGSQNAHYETGANQQELDEEAKRRISVLKICKNAVVMHDSDKTAVDAEINKHGKRLVDAVMEYGHGWLTEGRTVENYISDRVLRDIGVEDAPELFDNVLKAVQKVPGKTSITKVKLAHEVCEKMTLDDLSVDLIEELGKVVALIKQCNGMN